MNQWIFHLFCGLKSNIISLVQEGRVLLPPLLNYVLCSDFFPEGTVWEMGKSNMEKPDKHPLNQVESTSMICVEKGFSPLW